MDVKVEKIKAIELINSLVVVESDGDGEMLFYAYVRDNEKTRKVLDKLNADDWLSHSDGTSYADHYRADHDNSLIDISPIAFEYAEWFNGDMFLEFAP